MSNCVSPGCTGAYESDGYCNRCGQQAPQTSVPDPGSAGKPASQSPILTSTGPTAGRRVSTARGRPGAGPIVPPIPRREPLSAVLSDPRVPQERRICRICKQPLRRDRGYCPRDGTQYCFVPRLFKGEQVERRYEVYGCLAWGGLGWIFLAKDTRLGDTVAERWVVLKGLIDVGDPDAVAAAVNERRFLVEVDHPNIVKIYDFAQHPDPFTGAMVGYIVMEYLGGRTLHDIFSRHLGPDGQRAPLPLPTVLDYGMEVLRALGYLHEKGLVYCDLKPDNVIQVEGQVKLIDLGAVLRTTDRSGAVYGTPGYQAPELEQERDPAEPSVASDLYTVGRMLAVLSFDFTGFSSKTYRHRLPDPVDDHLLAREESFHRLLRRATHDIPARRFESAEEMREQLLGVRAEVLSIEDGE